MPRAGSSGRGAQDRTTGRVSRRVDMRSSRRYRLRSEDRYGNMFTHLFASPGNRQGAGRLYTKREFRFDEVVYSVRSAAALAFPPEATITQGARSAEGRVYAVSPTKYRIVLRSWPGFSGRTPWWISIGSDSMANTS